MQFYPIPIAATHTEIDGDAKTLLFNVPAQLAEEFQWHAGQHITLSLPIDGQTVRRPYTISQSPQNGASLQITVKRVKGGLVSNHINDHIKEGDVIDIAPPTGQFLLIPVPEQSRHHYFFGAGSGITPLFAMTKAVLEAEPNSSVYLLYGNRNEQQIIFQQALSALETQYPERVTVRHVLSEQNTPATIPPKQWRQGRINPQLIAQFLADFPALSPHKYYYICGPGSMNNDVSNALSLLSIPPDSISYESFANPVNTPTGDGEENTEATGATSITHQPTPVAANVNITLHGNTHELFVDENQTILEAMLDNGLYPPYSCQAGVCGSCQADVTDGSVHMPYQAALNDAEISAGRVLTCQALCTSDKVTITF